MKLEQQVSSLELSKRLKELGVKQDSLFYWQQGYQEMKGGVNASGFEITQKKTESKKGIRCFSAFTVAELGEMLPATPIIESTKYYLECCKYAKWHTKYVHYEKGIGYLLGGHKCEFNGDTEADARAKMLIYLLENNLITL